MVEPDDLRQTLAALRIRVNLIAADPTCRWAQEDNLAIVDRLLEQVEVLVAQTARAAGPTARSERRRLIRSRA